MRKTIFVLILIFGIMGSLSVFAHGVEEELKGKAILEKLEAKEVNCQDLTDEDFEALGEYFMGQMAGTSHEAMNNMMEQMMGEEGEEEMHIAMGKRMSNCEPNASMPQNMMNMMMGGGMTGGGMMGNNLWDIFGWSGWIMTILVWVWVVLGVLGIVALIKWLIKK